MRKAYEGRIDHHQPALLVLTGATKRKRRPLTGEVTLLGSSPGCDVGLASPDVAPVHSLIVFVAGRWRIRDCSGRATRVNGRAVQDEALRHGDVVQIGTFSFEAHLPPGAAPARRSDDPAQPPLDVGHLVASRGRFARRALSLRRRLREAEQGRHEIEQRERDLAQLEQRLRAAPREQHPRPDPRIDERKAELDHFARHLRRMEQKLREQESRQHAQAEAERASYEADLVRARVELEQERRELADLRRHVAARHVELEQTAALLEEELSREKERLERDREQVARERVYLDGQRQELIQMRSELDRRAGDGVPTSSDTRMDEPPPQDRLESARRLLRQLAERRKSLAQRQAQ